METISLKLDENIMHSMDVGIKKHNYSTRTEFIREAIRDKLDLLSRGELIKRLLSFKGSAKRHISDKEMEKIKQNAFDELCKERGWD